jgi:2-polyprenyl-3-methyl-5-hydroxy-6-metoxy-1,4-benzoquinol methylase
MQKSRDQEKSCPACSSSNTEVRASRKWELYQCHACSHVFSPYRSEAINHHFEGSEYGAWRTGNINHLTKRSKKRIDLVIPFIPTRPGRALEIGCSTGETLQVLSSEGWEAFGVDLSETALSICRNQYPNVSVAVGTCSADLGKQGIEPFDLVMAFHVVEHIPDLSKLGINLASSCREGSILYICVPNWDSWCRRVMGDDWPDLMSEHLQYFGRDSIKTWLNQAGFDIVHIETGSTAWPWLGGIRRKAAGKLSRNNAADRSMPGRGSMKFLRLANILFWPLLAVEKLFGTGNELRVVARYSTST